MKGKGKKSKDADDEEEDEDECPLQFIEFEAMDNASAPVYSSVLNKTEDEAISLEVVDSLQLELENLLVACTKRQRLLEHETEALLNWQEAAKPKSKGNPVKGEVSGKRTKAPTEEKSHKRFKDTSSVINILGKSHLAKSKSKNVPMRIQDFTDYPDPPNAPQTHIARNDVPDKFWKFIEPYCSPIKLEHTKYLEEYIKSYEDDADLLKIPNLGKHYLLKWNQSDSWENTNEGAKSGDKRRGGSTNSPTSKTKGGKRTKSIKNDSDKSTYGVLTQRLVSCLIEDNVISSPISDTIDTDHEIVGKNGASSNANPLRGLNLGNTAQLEKRIKKELEDHGLLDLDDMNMNDEEVEEDEILNELTKLQNDLKALSSQNQLNLKKLLGKVKSEFGKQEVTKKLNHADSEVLECYRKMTTTRQKKRSPTKKEKEITWKALKERDIIVKQLAQLDQDA